MNKTIKQKAVVIVNSYIQVYLGVAGVIPIFQEGLSGLLLIYL